MPLTIRIGCYPRQILEGDRIDNHDDEPKTVSFVKLEGGVHIVTYADSTQETFANALVLSVLRDVQTWGEAISDCKRDRSRAVENLLSQIESARRCSALTAFESEFEGMSDIQRVLVTPHMDRMYADRLATEKVLNLLGSQIATNESDDTSTLDLVLGFITYLEDHLVVPQNAADADTNALIHALVGKTGPLGQVRHKAELFDRKVADAPSDLNIEYWG